MNNREWRWTNCDKGCKHSKVWYEEKFIGGVLTGITYCQCTANKYHKVGDLDKCPFFDVEGKND